MFIVWVTDGIKCYVMNFWSDELGACPSSTIVRIDLQPVVDIATSRPHPTFSLSLVPNMELFLKVAEMLQYPLLVVSLYVQL